MQMGNVLHRYLLDFVILASGDNTQTVNTTADESFALAAPKCLSRITTCGYVLLLMCVCSCEKDL